MQHAHVLAIPSRTEKVLAAYRLFSGLDEDTIRDLARRVTTRKLVRGERLWSAGDTPTHFTLIQTGLFKIIRTAADGSEAIVALFGPRESIGDVAVIGRKPYPAAAIVCSDHAEVLRVPAEALLATMNQRLDVACSFNRTLIDHTVALEEKIRVMSAGSVPKRLATLLLGLGERFGDDCDDGAIHIPIALSRNELACLIGARVETTIRTIRLWEKAGIVETNDHGFAILDAEALRRKTTAREDE
jgi:CRP/FNR family transcriptional regulator, nitrogen oxide reductase regulator